MWIHVFYVLELREIEFGIRMGKQATESEQGQKIAQFGDQWDLIPWKSFLPSFFDAN
jgi:hypothetical protein